MGTVEGLLVPEPWKRRDSAGPDVQGPVTEDLGRHPGFLPHSFNRSQSRRQKILEGDGCRGRRRVVKIQPTCACGFLCGSSFQRLGLPGIPASHTCYRGRAQGRAPLTPGAGPACSQWLPPTPTGWLLSRSHTWQGGKAHSRLPHSSPSP